MAVDEPVGNSDVHQATEERVQRVAANPSPQNSPALNEVVVVGYSTVRKSDVTGAVSTVNVTPANKLPATSSEQLLEGKASGVQVINSGAPGSASEVFIRGISDFGHSQPLYVVDGVQTSDMSSVNPNDIESMSVLRDAGATAIYGASGGNGVIVITTKKGKANVNSNHSNQNGDINLTYHQIDAEYLKDNTKKLQTNLHNIKKHTWSLKTRF